MGALAPDRAQVLVGLRLRARCRGAAVGRAQRIHVAAPSSAAEVRDRTLRLRNLNLHFHSIVLDGVYQHVKGGAVRFRRLPPPTNADGEQTTRRSVRRLRRLLIRRGLTPDAGAAAADPLPGDQPVLAEIYAASVCSRIAMGERAGLGVLRIGDLVDPEEAAFVTGPRVRTSPARSSP